MELINSKINGGGDDLISRLPDEILSSILCRLSNMEETVRTSILSSRWRKLWTYISVYNFDSSYRANQIISLPNYTYPLLVQSCNAYISWVNRVLESHRPDAKTVDEIRIRFCLSSAFTSGINSLITFAVKNNVHCLELDLSPFENHHLNDNFFSLERHPFLSSNPLHLRVLRFNELDMSDDMLNYILLNSPCLEQLYICGAWSLKNIIITGPSSSKLKYFEMRHCQHVEQVVISQPSLECLKFLNVSRIKLVLNNLPQLVDVGLGFGESYNVSEIPLVLSSCLVQIQKLEAVVTIEKHGAPGELAKWPTFGNLRHLELSFGIDEGTNFCPLMSFIEACPVIQTLQLEYNWMYDLEESVRCIPERKTPKVAQKKNSFRFLKVVEVKGYVGDTEDAEFVAFLVENAKSLKKLIVTLSNLEYAGIKSEYLEWENQLTKESAIQLKSIIPPGAEFQMHPPPMRDYEQI